MFDEVQSAIMTAIDQRGPTQSVCPSEIARAIWPDDWRSHMDDVRTAAAALVTQGHVQVTQRGKVVDLSTVTGAIRLRVPPRPSAFRWHSVRFGLCCQFAAEPIAFRTTTATSLMRQPRDAQLQKLSQLCLINARSLLAALEYCAGHQIGAFRINSALWPVKTHPEVGYRIDELPDAAAIVETLQACRQYALTHDVRTTFHPDQFVVLNSPRPEVVERSIADLEYHTELAELVGADVVNVHGGGSFGDKPAALTALVRQIERLPESIRARLTLENDDRVFTPQDLLPVCQQTGIPLIYDVHHHRCLTDGLTIEAATEAALATWNREPLFHLSSPLEGWSGPRPERHHDEIDPDDFPECWIGRMITVDVEAKAKEQAVSQLINQLCNRKPMPGGTRPASRRRS